MRFGPGQRDGAVCADSRAGFSGCCSPLAKIFPNWGLSCGLLGVQGSWDWGLPEVSHHLPVRPWFLQAGLRRFGKGMITEGEANPFFFSCSMVEVPG